MSDTKLRPEDLTSEERAIVDEIAMNYIRNDYEPHGEYGAFAQAARQAEPIILARRALFAPAPEKVAKVETMADRIAADLKAGTFRGEQPAPPEPAAPVNGSTPVGEYDPDMKPAAREMPEAVRVGTFQLEELLKYADLAEVSLRTGFSPPDFLGADLPYLLRSSIAAVRQQAAQGRKVELGKVRELIFMVRNLTPYLAQLGYADLSRSFNDYADAALAEIDAAEGKRTAGEHMSELSGEPLPHYLRDARLTANGMRAAAEIARNFRPKSACTCGGYISFHYGIPCHQPGCLVGECLEIADEIDARANEIDETPDRWLAELDAAEGKVK